MSNYNDYGTRAKAMRLLDWLEEDHDVWENAAQAYYNLFNQTSKLATFHMEDNDYVAETHMKLNRLGPWADTEWNQAPPRTAQPVYWNNYANRPERGWPTYIHPQLGFMDAVMVIMNTETE